MPAPSLALPRLCLPLQVHAAAGLKSLLSASSGVQLSQHAHASLTATWQPHVGMGLQVRRTRGGRCMGVAAVVGVVVLKNTRSASFSGPQMLCRCRG